MHDTISKRARGVWLTAKVQQTNQSKPGKLSIVNRKKPSIVCVGVNMSFRQVAQLTCLKIKNHYLLLVRVF